MLTYTHDRFIAEKIPLIAQKTSVLDVGGGERFSKWLAPYAPLFQKTQYLTFDYDTQTNADIVGDIHAIPLPDCAVEAIICSSVLEHVRDPLTAMRELHRVLSQHGVLFLYVPSMYPYHAREGHYPDLWRFFEDTVHVLFKDFSKVEIQKRGGYFLALSFFVPLQHRMRRFLDIFAYILDTLFQTERRHTTSGYYVYAEK